MTRRRRRCSHLYRQPGPGKLALRAMAVATMTRMLNQEALARVTMTWMAGLVLAEGECPVLVDLLAQVQVRLPLEEAPLCQQLGLPVLLVPSIYH